MNYTGQKSL